MHRSLALATAAALMLPSLALAADAPDKEYRELARCTVATSLFHVLVTESRWAGATAADKALVARASAADQVLQKRAGAVLAALGKEQAEAILQDEVDAAEKRLEGATDANRDAIARDALDHYAPVLEACIVHAGTLIG